MCSFPSSDDPARRSRCVLRLGGAETILACAGAGDRRRRRGARRELQARRTASEPPWAILRAPVVPAGDRRLAAQSAYSEASKAVFEVFHDASLFVGDLDRRGIPRRARHGADCRYARRDRRAVTQRRASACRSSDHGGCGAHEVPGEGCERRREARRPACRAAEPRARLPSSNGCGV